MTLLLGCVADDITGATDMALMLAGNGMRTVQVIGVPPAGRPLPDADAIVVALKSRTIPAAQAVAQSLEAATRLTGAGARQLFFKYCSTFDSTDDGNIGPVAEALLDHLRADFAIACPAFPENRRTVYKGHLFVGDVPISESSMRDHPLTPMRDANLVRVLGRQCGGASGVGLVPWETVIQGPEAMRAAFAELRGAGRRLAIVDALTDDDLRDIGRACDGVALVTGGSGVGMGLPENYRAAGILPERAGAEPLPRLDGGAAVLSGSCSAATNRQVAVMAAKHPSLRLDPLALAAGTQSAADVLAWAAPLLADGPVLVYSTAEPESVGNAQAQIGKEKAAATVEAAFAAIAEGLVEAGVRKLIVAGGETAGAVVAVLGVDTLRIGPEIDPGVPWTIGVGEPEMCLALKSGNFGADDFFTKSFAMLP
jgi:3-dehydrotetronate 4-kinase